MGVIMKLMQWPVTIIIILASFSFVACAPAGTPGVPGYAVTSPYSDTPTPYAVGVSQAEATYQAAAQQAQIAAQQATNEAMQLTRQSGEATAAAQAITTGTAQAVAQAQTATAESLAVRVTEYAISAQATSGAISVQATGTAVAQIAQAEQRLIEDEARRLALQREQEQAALEYQRRINTLKPYLWGGLVFAVVIVAIGFTYRLYQRSRPVVINDVSGPRVLVPANSYQVLSSPARRPALPQPHAMLEAPATPVTLPPMTQGHILIAGETGSGKSTAMLAALKRRQHVIVLDPHDDNATWGQAQVVGGGRDFQAIGEYMEQMKHLLSDRYAQRAQGQKQFDPLTVATDEMPAIVAALGRGIDETWRMWLREGRKVGLFFVVSTQSTRVKTLGIKGEGDLLENFNYVVLLGKVAAGAYPDLVQGMERPAIIRTVDGARPVTIPYEPPQANTGTQTPIFIAPPAAAEEAGTYADPTNMSETTRARIRRLAGELSSQAAVERAVFGYNGGAAYRAVKEVLNGSATG